jgi:hypothetical protein
MNSTARGTIDDGKAHSWDHPWYQEFFQTLSVQYLLIIIGIFFFLREVRCTPDGSG